MARIVKEEDYAVKVNEILDAAQHLLYTKGYERMTIQDMLDALRISKGAFYHYFDSKAAVLDAYVERMQRTVVEASEPIVSDPHLSAVEKFLGFFALLDRLRYANRAAAMELMHVWYADENAIVRQKVDDAVIEQRAPLLNAIIQQGIAEGVFNTAHPDQAGQVILHLLHGMSNSHIKLFLALDQGADERATIDQIITVYAAYMDAVERTLGAPPMSLRQTAAENVEMWVSVLRDEGSNQARD